MNQQHSSSWGTPIVLLFLGFCGAYFGAFTFWRSKQTGASQDFWKNMPQYELWSSLPAVCKDGANFVMSGGQKQVCPPTHMSTAVPPPAAPVCDLITDYVLFTLRSADALLAVLRLLIERGPLI